MRRLDPTYRRIASSSASLPRIADWPRGAQAPDAHRAAQARRCPVARLAETNTTPATSTGARAIRKPGCRRSISNFSTPLRRRITGALRMRRAMSALGDEAQRIAPQMQEIADAGGEQTCRLDEHGVLRQQIQPLQHALKHQSRLARAALADQQQSPALRTHARAVQRHEALHTTCKSEHGELEQLVARVIREAEHFARNGNESGARIGAQCGEIVGIDRSTQQSAATLRAQLRRLARGEPGPFAAIASKPG